MRIDVLTKEYPPAIYGGAGVHVAELVRALRGLPDLDVHVQAFGEARGEAGVSAYADLPQLAQANAALQTLGVDLEIAAGCAGTELVHSHTWYANLGGHLAGLLYDVPHVVTAHSLEPLRPWKAEQLGGGYAVSSFAERTSYLAAAAVIAVSAAMRDDVLDAYPDIDPGRVHVVHNGIDTTSWSRVDAPDVVRSHGVDPDRPSVVFVGRITRQKGLPLFLRACRELPPGVQLVLCAGAPDTPEILAEVEALVAELAAARDGVVWIREMLPRADVVALLSAATAFVCPSIYEPLGIVNLEAMACETAVVATATGGIPEVVVHGETGLLVPIEQAGDGTGAPLDPDRYVADFAEALTSVLADPGRAAEMGRAGRRRAIASFSWDAIAERTRAIYDALV
ncbi:MAG TPA: glycogen synthase [Nocardioides sp.]|uniref:glycogen synthase n=1 Tax=Nocardioides sp. TaxID=35761 RepID=UPI002E354E67|nr:glycogen synthase [Nocardioides sp.]HEX3930898.1 glycogen synthase [Nocardioides sp.]